MQGFGKVFAFNASLQTCWSCLPSSLVYSSNHFFRVQKPCGSVFFGFWARLSRLPSASSPTLLQNPVDFLLPAVMVLLKKGLHLPLVCSGVFLNSLHKASFSSLNKSILGVSGDFSLLVPRFILCPKDKESCKELGHFSLAGLSCFWGTWPGL